MWFNITGLEGSKFWGPVSSSDCPGQTSQVGAALTHVPTAWLYAAWPIAGSHAKGERMRLVDTYPISVPNLPICPQNNAHRSQVVRNDLSVLLYFPISLTVVQKWNNKGCITSEVDKLSCKGTDNKQFRFCGLRSDLHYNYSTLPIIQ